MTSPRKTTPHKLFDDLINLSVIRRLIRVRNHYWRPIPLFILLLLVSISLPAQARQDRPVIDSSNAQQVSPTQRISAHEVAVLEVASAPDGSLIASGGSDGAVKLWRSDSGELVHNLQGHSAAVRSLEFSPDGALLLSSSDDRTARLWRVADGEPINVVDAIFDARIVEAAFSPDGRLIAYGTHRCALELRNAETGVLWKTIVPANCPPGSSGSVEFWGLAFTPDGSRVVVGDGRPCCGGGAISVWSVEEYSPPEVLRGNDLVVRDLSHSPTQPRLAVALVGLSKVWLMDAANGAVLTVLAGHDFRVNALDFNVGGDLLATASNDTTMILWDVERAAALAELTEHRRAVNEVDFSADGTLLISGSQDGEVIVWGVP